MTLSRTYRPLVLTVFVVTSAVFPRIWAIVVKLTPSVDTRRSKSWVSQPANSPPAPACRMVIEWMVLVEPRSTWRNLVASSEHHLSLVPPVTLPLTALSGVSVLLHAVEPVAGRFNARLLDGGGGGPPPASYSGRRAGVPVAHDGGGAPSRKSSAPPELAAGAGWAGRP